MYLYMQISFPCSRWLVVLETSWKHRIISCFADVDTSFHFLTTLKNESNLKIRILIFQNKYYQVNCGTHLCLREIVFNFKKADWALTNSGTSKLKAANKLTLSLKVIDSWWEFNDVEKYLIAPTFHSVIVLQQGFRGVFEHRLLPLIAPLLSQLI